MKKILEAVAAKVITPEQAEWLLSNDTDLPTKPRQPITERVIDVKDIDVPTINYRINRLDQMMRECYGYILKKSTDTSSCYILYNGSKIIDEITISHNDFSVNVTNEEWVKGYNENLKKYGLI